MKPTDTTEALAQALHNLEVAANGVAYCYARNPGNFYKAMRALEDDATAAREVLKRYREAFGSQSAAMLALTHPRVCASCSPDGVFATDGTGPYDGYTCGRPE